MKIPHVLFCAISVLKVNKDKRNASRSAQSIFKLHSVEIAIKSILSKKKLIVGMIKKCYTTNIKVVT